MSSPDRQTTDPIPLPSDPAKSDTLTRAARTGGSTDATAASGIPFAGQSGVADAGSGAPTDTDSESATDSARQTASANPAPAGTPAHHGQPAAPAASADRSTSTPTTSARPAGADGTPGRDDGLLDSIGKAISSPIRGAAEDEEPK